MSEIPVLLSNEEFTDASEEEIVELAKEGNRYAIEFIVNRYRNFVKARSKSYFLVGADREDVIQEGMIGLYKAIRDFNQDKKVTFKTFAELCITRHIITAVKTATRQKHMPLNYYVSLNTPESGFSYTESVYLIGEKKDLDPEQIIIEREDVHGMECEIDKILSRFEAKVLMYHLNGISYGQIALHIGKDPKSIDNALQRIKRKLEKFLLTKKV